MSRDDKLIKNRFRKLIPEPQPHNNSSNHNLISDPATGKRQPANPYQIQQYTNNFRFSRNQYSSQLYCQVQNKQKKGRDIKASKKLKTIQDLQAKKQQKHYSSLADYNYQRIRSQNIQTEDSQSKLKQKASSKILELIEQFKLRTDTIMKMQNLKDLKEPKQHQQQLQTAQQYKSKLYHLLGSTRMSSARLIYIYLNRAVSSQQRLCFESLQRFTSQAIRPYYHEQVQITLRARPPITKQPIPYRRQRLLNIDKFFQSR